MAYKDDKTFIPLNQNYGIIFAPADIDERNVICEKGLKNPHLFRMDNGNFGLVAVRMDAAGNEDNDCNGRLLLWTSPNLIEFTYHGLVEPQDTWTVQAKMKKETLLPETCPGNVLEVTPAEGEKIVTRWMPLRHVQTLAPEMITVSSADELEAVKATAVYSDASTSEKNVLWDISGIDFSEAGTYTITGTAVQPIYPFPLAKGYADPVIMPRDNRYYYLATNDNTNNIGLFVRDSDTIDGLFAPGYNEELILGKDEEKGFVQTFWAPEFHEIGGELYILFAVGGKQWGPQCHMMKLKKDGDIMRAGDWEAPVRVKQADGTYLTQDGITLDMTYFNADGRSFLAWSYRKGIGTPLDTGSMIYIAAIDEQNPTMLTGEPVLLTRPLLGWENMHGTINNEGPYPLITQDTVYLAYSGGAAGGYTYSIGMLSAPRGSDYLDIRSWKKAGTPLLKYYSLEGVYGAGHNSFFRDTDGTIMIAYHGEEKIVRDGGPRCSGMHRVHFAKDGRLVLDLCAERDLDPSLTKISTTLNIQPTIATQHSE